MAPYFSAGLREHYLETPNKWAPKKASRTPNADHPFLHDARGELAVAREEQSAAQAAARGRVRAVLQIEQPVVGATGTVEPYRVIEAGDCDAPIAAIEQIRKRGRRGTT